MPEPAAAELASGSAAQRELRASASGVHGSSPELSVERPSSETSDDDFEGESEEYDTGEVTVVADASQLNMLRETLGRADAPHKAQTPTPVVADSSATAPSTPAASPAEAHAEEPVLDLLAAKSASQALPEHAASEPAAAPSAVEPSTTAALQGKRPEQSTSRVKPAPTGRSAKTWVIAVLLIVAAIVIAAVYAASKRPVRGSQGAPAAGHDDSMP